MSKKIQPVITLRALREREGLTSPMLAERIKERGVKVDPDHLLSVELGHKRAGYAVLAAWANVLGIKPVDILQARELRDLLTEAEREEVDGSDKAA